MASFGVLGRGRIISKPALTRYVFGVLLVDVTFTKSVDNRITIVWMLLIVNDLLHVRTLLSTKANNDTVGIHITCV